MSSGADETSDVGELILDSVCKWFGNVPAVDHVSLRIHTGEFVSLLGPSGAGKSSLLRIIGGFEQLDAGRIKLGREDVTYTPPYRRNVNTVFQHYALFPHMTVAENVVYGLRQAGVPHSERGPKVREALEMVQMLALADRKPNELSGGQQQRVALARALINRPNVLLLDEPLGALDLKLRQQMQIELKRIHREFGITFVYVTHDQGEALAMSDRIAVMRDGRVEQVGTREELYDEPANSFVGNFIGSQNFFLGKFDQRTGCLVTDAGVVIEAGRVTGHVPDQAKAMAGIRPEHVMLAREVGADDPNQSLGVIQEIVHSGDVLEYVVRLDDGMEIFSRIPRILRPDLERGARIAAHWDREHATIFHE